MPKADDDCTATPCSRKATHTLSYRALLLGGMVREQDYCLDCALYFYAWLMYCYPGEYEMIGITPPASELFNRN